MKFSASGFPRHPAEAGYRRLWPNVQVWRVRTERTMKRKNDPHRHHCAFEQAYFRRSRSARKGLHPEHYAAVWAVTGGAAGGATVPVDIRITRYNTQQEIAQYATLLAKSGRDALRSALEKEDVGQLSPVGKVGVPLVIARKIQVEGKTVVRVLTLRDMSYQELPTRGGRSTTLTRCWSSRSTATGKEQVHQ